MSNAEPQKVFKREEHWVTEILCDHEKKLDKAFCACGWVGSWMFNVGQAVADWWEHVSAGVSNDMLRHVVGSLKMYPNGGGAIQVMAEVDRILKAERERMIKAMCRHCRNGVAVHDNGADYMPDKQEFRFQHKIFPPHAPDGVWTECRASQIHALE